MRINGYLGFEYKQLGDCKMLQEIILRLPNKTLYFKNAKEFETIIRITTETSNKLFLTTDNIRDVYYFLYPTFLSFYETICYVNLDSQKLRITCKYKGSTCFSIKEM